MEGIESINKDAGNNANILHASASLNPHKRMSATSKRWNQIININHNISDNGVSGKTCNLWSANLFLLTGFCLRTNVVYKSVAKRESNLYKVYIRSMVNFKTRYRACINSFVNEIYCNYATLASYIHDLKKKNRG